MKYAGVLLAAGMVLAASNAGATPPIVAAAGAQAIAGAAATGGEGGTGTGGSGGSATSKDNSTTVGAALGQAPTAAAGDCAKGTKGGFGVIEWTDFSDKCLNYALAMEAARQQRWDLANQWVRRADGMEQE